VNKQTRLLFCRVYTWWFYTHSWIQTPGKV